MKSCGILIVIEEVEGLDERGVVEWRVLVGFLVFLLDIYLVFVGIFATERSFLDSWDFLALE